MSMNTETAVTTRTKLAPPPEPKPLKRFLVEYDYRAEFEAEDEGEARDLARSDIGPSNYEFYVRELGPAPAEECRVPGVPEAWSNAMLRVSDWGWRYITGGMVGESVVVTDGRVALVVASVEAGIKIDEAPDGGKWRIDDLGEPVDRSEQLPANAATLVRIGDRYFDANYVWLVELLFGDVQWHAPAGHDFAMPATASIAGKPVAVVMPRNDEPNSGGAA